MAWEVRVAAEVRQWRERAVATADPAWSREGSAVHATAGGHFDEVPGATAAARAAVAVVWPTPVAGQTSVSVAEVAGPAEVRGVAGRWAWVAGPAVMCAGIGVIVASGMRWATVRAYGFVEFTIHGTDPDQHGRLTVILGILAVVAGLLLAGGRRDAGRMLAAMTGLMVLLTSVVDLMHIYQDGPFAEAGLDADISVGPGLWLVAACGVVVLLAGGSAAAAGRRLGRIRPSVAGADRREGGSP